MSVSECRHMQWVCEVNLVKQTLIKQLFFHLLFLAMLIDFQAVRFLINAMNTFPWWPICLLFSFLPFYHLQFFLLSVLPCSVWNKLALYMRSISSSNNKNNIKSRLPESPAARYQFKKVWVRDISNRSKYNNPLYWELLLPVTTHEQRQGDRRNWQLSVPSSARGGNRYWYCLGLAGDMCTFLFLLLRESAQHTFTYSSKLLETRDFEFYI